MPPRLYLIRHGQTDRSLSGQHTGRTDLPLTEQGQQDARDLAKRLRAARFSLVFTSPRQRARRTCRLAGLDAVAEFEPDLAEWDDGDYDHGHNLPKESTMVLWNGVTNEICDGVPSPPLRRAVRCTFLPDTLSINAIRGGMIPVMTSLMSRDMSTMKPISVRFRETMSLAVMASAVTTFPVNWWLVKRGLKYGMGGAERASLRHSVAVVSKLTAMFLTLAMLAGGIILAGRYGNFSMRAADSTDTKPMSSRASVESGRDLHR